MIFYSHKNREELGQTSPCKLLGKQTINFVSKSRTLVLDLPLPGKAISLVRVESVCSNLYPFRLVAMGPGLSLSLPAPFARKDENAYTN